MIGKSSVRRGAGGQIRRLMSNVMKHFHFFFDPFPLLRSNRTGYKVKFTLNDKDTKIYNRHHYKNE